VLVCRSRKEPVLSWVGFKVSPLILQQLSCVLLFGMLLGFDVQGPLLSINVAFVHSARRGDVPLLYWSSVVAIGLHAGRQECHM